MGLGTGMLLLSNQASGAMDSVHKNVSSDQNNRYTALTFLQVLANTGQVDDGLDAHGREESGISNTGALKDGGRTKCSRTQNDSLGRLGRR